MKQFPKIAASLISLLFLISSPIAMSGQVRKTPTGIIISGTGRNVRAMEPYSGSSKRMAAYATTVNNAAKKLGPGVKVYCMIYPNSSAFYCPPEAQKWTRDQKSAIHQLYSGLASNVKAVDAYSALEVHKSEPIYSRTDHHWAPLGAFYAAQAFADAAGVTFLPLSSYTRKVTHGYVGSMAAFSKDAAVRNAPEDFVYYEPKGVNYTVTYIPYVGKGKVKREGKPRAGKLFYHYKDGSGAAYCTFMQGDQKIAQIRTNTNNGRKLLILKDSYGNALPGCLLGSFAEVHVVDFRFFSRNLPRYVKEHGITDVLFANNLVHANNAAVASAYNRFLTQ